MKSKIMVVDDEMHIRELVRFYLDKAGSYGDSVYTAGNHSS